MLLRNEGNLLPLTKGDSKVSSIAVIGPLADSKRDMRGPWTLADDKKPLSAWSKAFAGWTRCKVNYAQGSISVGRIRQYSPYSPARVRAVVGSAEA